MRDLITRLEVATGPDRELDVEIFRVLHPEYAGPEWQPYGSGLRHVNDSSDMRCLPSSDATPDHYTASIDAALAVIREAAGGKDDLNASANALAYLGNNALASLLCALAEDET